MDMITKFVNIMRRAESRVNVWAEEHIRSTPRGRYNLARFRFERAMKSLHANPSSATLNRVMDEAIAFMGTTRDLTQDEIDKFNRGLR